MRLEQEQCSNRRKDDRVRREGMNRRNDTVCTYTPVPLLFEYLGTQTAHEWGYRDMHTKNEPKKSRGEDVKLGEKGGEGEAVN